MGVSWRAPLWAAALAVLGACLQHLLGARHPAVRPFRARLLCSLPQFQGTYANAMLWGTYRPGLYLGLRMRHPESLVAGLMWFDPDRPNALGHIRHLAQEGDGLWKYCWEAHDGESFGRQELHDEGLHITTSLAKRFCEGCVGGDWALRIRAREAADGNAPGEQKQRVSLVFYIGDERGSSAGLELMPDPASEHRTLVMGSSELVGKWGVHLHTAGGSASKVHFLGASTPHFHNLTDLVREALAEPADAAEAPLRRRGRAAVASAMERHPRLPDAADAAPNVALFQVTAELPLELDLVFTGSLTGEAAQQQGGGVWAWARRMLHANTFCLPALPAGSPAESVPERVAALSGERLTQLLAAREAEFDARFQRTFGDFLGTPEGTARVAKAALSNMLGGIGYFHGSSDVRLPNGRVVRSWPAALFSAVPSRPFFPRGFIWDEGFHQLLIRRWDARLSRDILAHWLDLLSADGWIAREQILGEEARARVPADFIVQSPDVANPPTLFLPLADMAQAVAGGKNGSSSSSPQEDLEFLGAAYPRMEAWFRWFTRTQAGEVPGSYRWRGREPAQEYDAELNKKTFASGLDDYPRSSHPSDAERHVDLYCWMLLASRSLASIAATLGVPEQRVSVVRELAGRLADVERLSRMHWDAAAQQFRDWGNHTEATALRWVQAQNPQGQVTGTALVRIVGKPHPSPQFVPYFGYVGLFPLLMRMLPGDSPQLAAVLRQLRSPQELWTAYGLRSLSATASLYNQSNTQHDAPYWRAPVWVNVNYLALAALKHYSRVAGEQRQAAGEIHDELRANLLRNMVAQYRETGFLWENYRDESGRGQGSHPFTGWSALLVLIAGEKYFDL